MATLSVTDEFSWTAAPQRYRWILARRIPGDGELRGPSGQPERVLIEIPPQDPQDSPDDERTITYDLFSNYEGLFLTLAKLDPTEPEILRFARRFGLLGAPVLVEPSAQDATAVRLRGEPLSTWQNEISSLHNLINLTMEQGAPKLWRPGLQLQSEKDAAWIEIIQQYMAVGVAEHVNARLTSPLGMRILPHPTKTFQMVLRLAPRSLIEALWLQFALALNEAFNVNRQLQFETCTNCDYVWFRSRPGRRFCSDGCRVANTRKNRVSALQMMASGASIEEAARQIGTSAEQVRRWQTRAEED